MSAERFEPYSPIKKEKSASREGLEKWLRPILMAGILAGLAEGGHWAIPKISKKIKEEREAARLQWEFEEKVETFNVAQRESELYKNFKPEYSSEVDATSPKALSPYDDYSYKFDLDTLNLIESAARNKKISALNGAPKDEVEEFYRHLQRTRENRQRLKELNFHEIDDPRLRMVQSLVLDCMGIHGEERTKMLSKQLVIHAMELPVELALSKEGSDSENRTQITSEQLVRLLDKDDPNHMRGLCTAAHEILHRMRREQNGGAENLWKKYLEATANGTLPQNYINDESLPPEIREFIDLWLRKAYTGNYKKGPHRETVQELLEKEAMTVSAMVAIAAFRDGEVVKVNPKDKNLIPSSK